MFNSNYLVLQKYTEYLKPSVNFFFLNLPLNSLFIFGKEPRDPTGAGKVPGDPTGAGKSTQRSRTGTMFNSNYLVLQKYTEYL